jgi:hypothetical protein
MAKQVRYKAGKTVVHDGLNLLYGGQMGLVYRYELAMLFASALRGDSLLV